MRVVTGLLVLMLSLAPPAGAVTIRQIELRGNGRIYSSDAPVRRGRLFLFHRYPDGVYMSVAAEDVLGIAVTKAVERPKGEDAVLLGPTGEGLPGAPAVREERTLTPPGADGDFGYGYGGFCYGCYVPPAPPPRPGPPPPALVGPNGFPLPPGSPAPLPIGPNGFPILAPSPPPSHH